MTKTAGQSCLALALVLFCTACAHAERDPQETWSGERAAMIDQLKAYGIRDAGILEAMETVSRHEYIPESFRSMCDPYGDHPCPIGHGQTISQPYIVAYMTEKIAPKPGDRILEVGTGSGYQAAILAELGADVYSIEIIPELADHARRVLAQEGFPNVHVLTGDGYKGWPEHAPFDAVIVTCAPEDMPQTLVDQMKDGGRMIVPVGEGFQRLVILRKKDGEVEQIKDLPVRFVPMVHGS